MPESNPCNSVPTLSTMACAPQRSQQSHSSLQDCPRWRGQPGRAAPARLIQGSEALLAEDWDGRWNDADAAVSCGCLGCAVACTARLSTLRAIIHFGMFSIRLG